MSWVIWVSGEQIKVRRWHIAHLESVVCPDALGRIPLEDIDSAPIKCGTVYTDTRTFEQRRSILTVVTARVQSVGEIGELGVDTSYHQTAVIGTYAKVLNWKFRIYHTRTKYRCHVIFKLTVNEIMMVQALIDINMGIKGLRHFVVIGDLELAAITEMSDCHRQFVRWRPWGRDVWYHHNTPSVIAKSEIIVKSDIGIAGERCCSCIFNTPRCIPCVFAAYQISLCICTSYAHLSTTPFVITACEYTVLFYFSTWLYDELAIRTEFECLISRNGKLHWRLYGNSAETVTRYVRWHCGARNRWP
jgi:hypothetical protein